MTMATPQKIGERGERLAADYLEHKGYRLLAHNWRFKKAEVDLIAQDGRMIVFVEVKTRSYNLYGPPDLAVNHKKEAMLTAAAHAWIDENKYEGEIRFDVISILFKENKTTEINHIEDAFFWGLEF